MSAGPGFRVRDEGLSDVVGNGAAKPGLPDGGVPDRLAKAGELRGGILAGEQAPDDARHVAGIVHAHDAAERAGLRLVEPGDAAGGGLRHHLRGPAGVGHAGVEFGQPRPSRRA